MTAFLDPYRQSELSLTQLTEAARALLSRADAGPADERVTAFPDARTVRYYQSLGVVDKPTRYQGRSAIYGYRHLLQVVAVKLLQTRGFSLAQIQSALAGVRNAQLESAAVDALGRPGEQVPARPGPPSRPSPAHPPLPAPQPPRPLIAATLAPGVTVTLDPTLVANPQDVLERLARALPTPPEST